MDLTYDQLTQEERAQVKDYFHSVVLPILSPQIVGQRHPTPHLDNKALYITALLRSKSGKTSLGFIPLPTSLPPLFLLPSTRGRFLRLETILRQWAPTLFGKYKVEETCVISATRNADLTFDTEKFEDSEDDFRLLMTKLLQTAGQPVHCPPGAGPAALPGDARPAGAGDPSGDPSDLLRQCSPVHGLCL